jgi:hypothetical protein
MLALELAGDGGRAMDRALRGERGQDDDDGEDEADVDHAAGGTGSSTVTP